MLKGQMHKLLDLHLNSNQKNFQIPQNKIVTIRRASARADALLSLSTQLGKICALVRPQKLPPPYRTKTSLLPNDSQLTSQRRRAYFPKAARIVLREKSLISPIFFRKPFLQRTFSMGGMLLIPHLSLP